MISEERVSLQEDNNTSPQMCCQILINFQIQIYFCRDLDGPAVSCFSFILNKILITSETLLLPTFT